MEGTGFLALLPLVEMMHTQPPFQSTGKCLAFRRETAPTALWETRQLFIVPAEQVKQACGAFLPW